MSLENIFNIAGSGMSAQALRMNLTASNISNAESVSSSTEKTYRARHPVFASVMDQIMEDGKLPGVKIMGVVESQSPLRKRYDPNHPMADKQGYIFLPNVNVVEEMANMISASRSFQNNVEVVNTTKQLLLRTLSIGE